MSFPTKTIRQVTETLIDYRGKTPTKTASGTKLITAKVIKDGFIVDGNHEYIATDEYDTWMRRGLPKQWDILITTEAPLGEVAQLRSPERVALAQRVILLRGNPSVIDQSFYFHSLKSPFVQAGLRARSTGTTVLGIKQAELWNVEIPCPELTTQKRISSILSGYDDLIENNTRRIEILEQMAQMLYREWFVNLRFPGHEKVKVVESELGLIPEGWTIKPLGDVATITMGLSPKGDTYNEDGNGVPLINGPVEFGEGFARAMKWTTAPTKLCREGDLIICVRGSTTGRYVKSDASYCLGRGVCALSSKYQCFVDLLFQDQLPTLLAKTSGSTFPSWTGPQLKSHAVHWPSIELLDRFETLARPLSAAVFTFSRQIHNLRTTRDLLLPKLVSGEVRVEALEEDAVAETV
jgi:type I restriction enzyme, S subunit